AREAVGDDERLLVRLADRREEDEETLIVTDGFSCRTQIEHGTGRKALHLAEVAARALDGG
ncbi:MAG TPA: hypothetical protein VKA44_00575, partial [Gemmatimonadota bacterium]|nr:hypothetical protein [Gemmatimonadota bacterium]